MLLFVYNLLAHIKGRIYSQNVGLQRILCITCTVKHNYISPSSMVGIQLHVSALYVDHLQVVI